jgi:Peptidase family M49
MIIKNYKDFEIIKQQIAKLKPVEISCDLSVLSAKEREALTLMVAAAKYMDRIFLRQSYKENETIEKELHAKRETDANFDVLAEYFRINFGPFDCLDHKNAFINLGKKKPMGANYYPMNMAKEEFEAHLREHPCDEEAFTSNFTAIRRDDTSKLVAIPYSQHYKECLEPAAALLKNAAQLIENPSLKKYLNSRADAFSSNDYYQSDIDWVELKNHNLEIVIGPYEVYEDEWFGYKAAFEALITVVDRAESQKLQVIEGYLDEMEQHLPMDDKHKNFNRGKSSPIAVVNEVFSAGDTKAGIQTTAFNLPNDERVREAKGSKKVMLKNVAQAKFENCWIPIAHEVLAESAQRFISFDAYFNHVLMHEVSHGLGPGTIEKNGVKTLVGKELKDLYSVIEETKADILGVWNFQLMIDKGVFPESLRDNIYVTFLGGIFRSVRFGIGEAHGGANAIQMNYMLEKGGFVYDDQACRFDVNHNKIKDAVQQLAREVLEIEAFGDYERAGSFIKKYCYLSEPLKKAIAKVSHVPIDICPNYKV